MKSNVNIKFEGRQIGKLKHFKVVENVMSEFQTKHYMNAYKQDTQNIKKGVYTESRQASLFVFPDGSWGKKRF